MQKKSNIKIYNDWSLLRSEDPFLSAGHGGQNVKQRPEDVIRPVLLLDDLQRYTEKACDKPVLRVNGRALVALTPTHVSITGRKLLPGLFLAGPRCWAQSAPIVANKV